MFGSPIFQALALSLPLTVVGSSSPQCRTQPGDPGFPTQSQLAAFNSSIGGRLIPVVPSAQFCKTLPGGCPDALWEDAVFRATIPGAMNEPNWEQDYSANPPSLCFRNTTVCGQGLVPILGVNATTAAHIQAGVRFAQAHNLKVAVKASGHDFLGRSTAKNSLLLWTHHFQNITFHDSFMVGNSNKGSAATVGSGVALNTLYQAAKTQNKIFVGGTAASVAAAAGYVQGAGHSGLAPKFGLAADNALEFQIVLANGNLVTANEIENPDLFWALRGGGPGSWGVIISTTFRTFDTFNAVQHQIFLNVNSTDAVGQVAELQAQHVFDWDSFQAGHYFICTANGSMFTWTITTLFPNVSVDAATASMTPLLNGLTKLGFPFITTIESKLVNDILTAVTDLAGIEWIFGSRLIPATSFQQNPAAIGNAFKEIYSTPGVIFSIVANAVAGGQVAKNANISSAVNPKWRTAKAHIFMIMPFEDSTTPAEVETIRQTMTNTKVPILQAVAGGPGSGSYINEADVREPNFQVTFFGPNFPRLSAIKKVYDPDGMFIVAAGVGSEEWDTEGLCRLS